ncbi:MAG: hypothetical protein EXR65_01745 [Dehalococcoidia bacterium]|nr:hypothetical protein [Dehalococcoidia bacterium]
MTGDPMLYRAQADAIVQRAADQLRALLRTLAQDIDPFPPFPGSLFSYGIEVEPPGGDAERGCVVLGEDGELYELQIWFDVEQAPSGNPLAMRAEQRVPLAGLPPALYVAYAQRAVAAASEYLERRAQQQQAQQ